MLVVTRRAGESLILSIDMSKANISVEELNNLQIEVKIADLQRNVVKLGVGAPDYIKILRHELVQQSIVSPPIVATSKRPRV